MRYEFILTEPDAPFDSFLTDSHTPTASLKSPKTVANSANRLCCIGDAIPLAEEMEPDELEYPCEGVDGDGETGDEEPYDEPNNFLVVENSRVGNRRFDEYCEEWSRETTTIYRGYEPLRSSLQHTSPSTGLSSW